VWPEDRGILGQWCSFHIILKFIHGLKNPPSSLVAPMLIMTLHRTKLTSLLTTPLFVVAVGVVLAWQLEDAKNQDIVAAPAAYAAVLVIFVGAAMSTSG
jgi:hypothetical protein